MLEDKEKRQKRIQEKIRNYNKWQKISRKLYGAMSEEWIDRNSKRAANHGKLCSCHMCGNQRRFQRGANKLTQQERDSLLKLEESMTYNEEE